MKLQERLAKASFSFCAQGAEKGKGILTLSWRGAIIFLTMAKAQKIAEPNPFSDRRLKQMEYDGKMPQGNYDSPHKDEYDKMVEQIKAKRKAMSKSIWTDEPLLKPYKSIWIDDEEEREEVSQPQPVQPAAEEQAAEQVNEADPFNAHTPEYYEPNPVIRDARNEQLAFGVQPEHYDEVIMPFVNEYSVERKLPDQRRHLSRKPKANAAVEYAARNSAPRQAAPAQEQQAKPVMHKIRHERFFDDEGEPLTRHVPELSKRKRPKMIPLSQRRRIRQTTANDIDAESYEDDN